MNQIPKLYRLPKDTFTKEQLIDLILGNYPSEEFKKILAGKIIFTKFKEREFGLNSGERGLCLEEPDKFYDQRFWYIIRGIIINHYIHIIKDNDNNYIFFIMDKDVYNFFKKYFNIIDNGREYKFSRCKDEIYFKFKDIIFIENGDND